MRRSWWIVPAVWAADFISKQLAMRMRSPMLLVPGVVGLRYVHNSGMAFSLLSGQPWLLALLSVLLLALGALLLRRFRLGPMSRTGALLMLGGALGNLAERLISGEVTDMVELLFVHFAIFNVADIAVTVGCGLLALSLFLRPDEWTAREERKEGTR